MSEEIFNKSETIQNRHKFWEKDNNNKIGVKLLERMGWKPGKGLGASESGILTPIRPKRAFQGAENEAWTEHDDKFSKLLKELSNDENGVIEKPIKSLNEKAQKSKARLHYHKFTRGKDLALYSEKDLANILGRKVLQEEEKKVFDKGTINNGSSMVDYFKKKMPNFAKNLVNDSGSYELQTTGFGYVKTEMKKRKMDDECDEIEINVKRKKIKSVEECCFENPAFNDDSIKKEKKNKKKKKKNKKERRNSLEISEDGVVNGAFNDVDTEEANTTVDNPFEVKIEKSKKKKSKRKLNEIENNEETKKENGILNEAFDVGIIDNEITSNDGIFEDGCETKRKKKKKVKKESKGTVNPAFDQQIIQSLDMPIEDSNTDLILNVTSEVNVKKNEIKVSRSKSVRFSNVNQVHIVPTREQNDLFEINTQIIASTSSSSSSSGGIDNQCFNNYQENIDEMSKNLDNLQAEVENDLNEKKCNLIQIDEKKFIRLKKTKHYQVKKLSWLSNDIDLYFPNSNINEIHGYCVTKPS